MIANPPSYQNKNPPASATVPRPVLPLDAPKAGYVCGSGGIMTAGFELASIRAIWNIDRDQEPISQLN